MPSVEVGFMNCVERSMQRLPHGEELGALEQLALAEQSFCLGGCQQLLVYCQL
jgi:hypothetical protein